MPVSSLSNVVTGKFISALSKQSAGKAGSSTGVGGKQSSASSIDVTLRSTARSFAAGVQSLNAGISYVNVATNFNERLLSIVDQMDVLVGRAGKGNLGNGSAHVMRQEFQTLAQKYQDTIKKSKIEGKDVLKVEDLSSVLSSAGLEASQVEELASAFDKMTTISSNSSGVEDGAAGSVAGGLPVQGFVDALRKATLSDELEQDEGAAEDAAGSFREVRKALKGVRANIEGNLKGLDQTRDVLAKNLDLVRAAGFAFLDASDNVKAKETPEQLAERIRTEIISKAPSALSQAGNLQSIMVAGLTVADAQAKVDKKKTST